MTTPISLSTARIIIVDDESKVVELMERSLRAEGYINVRGYTDPRRVIAECHKERPDLILLDLRMPHLGGIELMEELKREFPDGPKISILILTGEDSVESKHKALSLGAADYLSKPPDKTEVLLRIRNLVETRMLYQRLNDYNRTLEAEVSARTLALARAQVEVLHRLAFAADYRDDDPGQHSHRVGVLAALLASTLGQSAREVELIRLAAPLHDVGKIGVPDRILLKPGELTPEEFGVMKSHTVIGGEILRQGPFPVLQMGREIAISHHEHWNGRGYSQGLAGEMIPLSARITAIADVFDAVTHPRRYGAAWSPEKAVAAIQEQSGRQFDPELVRTFSRLIRAEGTGPLIKRIELEAGQPVQVSAAII